MEIDLVRNMRTSLAQVSDPLEFIVLERMLKESTKQRSVAFRPSGILTGDFKKWQRGREVQKQIDDLCDEMWNGVCRLALTARNSFIDWQLNAPLRKAQMMEHFQNQQLQFEMVEKGQALFYHGLKMEEIREMNRGQDVRWRLEQVFDSFDDIGARISKIHNDPNLSKAEKHQRSQVLLDAFRSSLQ